MINPTRRRWREHTTLRARCRGLVLALALGLRSAASGADGVLEVFKYALKLSDLSPADRWEAFRVLKGKRLIRSWGSLRGVVIPDDLTDDPFDDAALERFIKLIYTRTATGYFLESGEIVTPDPPDLPTVDLRQVPY